MPATTNYVVEGQVQLDWQRYDIADSHQVQFRLDGQWTTLSADGSNPADIQLDYLNGGHTGKTADLPTDDEYADYEFRIARVVDGVATTDYREVSIVVIPDTPGNLRGGEPPLLPRRSHLQMGRRQRRQRGLRGPESRAKHPGPHLLAPGRAIPGSNPSSILGSRCGLPNSDPS